MGSGKVVLGRTITGAQHYVAHGLLGLKPLGVHFLHLGEQGFFLIDDSIYRLPYVAKFGKEKQKYGGKCGNSCAPQGDQQGLDRQPLHEASGVIVLWATRLKNMM